MNLKDFFDTVKDDPRISTTHISMYLAFVSCCGDTVYKKRHLINRPKIMQLAKISARSTYSKILHELDAYGYIRYRPDFGRNSTIEFIKLEGGV